MFYGILVSQRMSMRGHRICGFRNLQGSLPAAYLNISPNRHCRELMLQSPFMA